MSLFRIIFDIFFLSFFDYTRFARQYSDSVSSKIGRKIFRKKMRDIFSVIFVQFKSTADASLEKSAMQGKFGYIQENRERSYTACKRMTLENRGGQYTFPRRAEGRRSGLGWRRATKGER